MTRLTASSLWRAEPCPASAVLPAVRREYKDAQDGTRAHAALEAAPPPGSFAEVAFAYNVLSGEAREVGRSIGRNYGVLAEGEIPGTADLVTVQPDHVLVDDYKSGVGYLVPPLPGNPQLQHNSMCAALVYDKPRAIAQLVYLKTGEVKDAAYDCFDFAAISLRLRTIWERCRMAADAFGERAQPQELVALGLVNPGDHCWRCEAKKGCPIKGRRAA